MVRRLQKANGIETSNIVQTLSYEDHGDSAKQNSEERNIVKLDSVDETKGDMYQSSPTYSPIVFLLPCPYTEALQSGVAFFLGNMLLGSMELVNSSIYL